MTWHSRAHAARALQLTSERSRRTLAGALDRLLSEIENPDLTVAAVRPCPAQIRDASLELLELSGRLRDRAPVDAGAVARLRALVFDGAGPCYRRARGHALRSALQAAIREIDVES